MMNTLSDIKSFVNSLRYDIKAEAIIADLIDNGVDPNDIIALFQGSFKRKFEKDICFADIVKLNNDREILGIALTRDSIYDALPEGMFHKQSMKPVEGSKSMASDSKQQRFEEKGARDFFLPFENEIFYQQVNNELQERKILGMFNKNLFDDIMPEFWNLDNSLPKKYVSRLILLLPMVHKIVGDTVLTAKALEMILNEKIKARINTKSKLNNEVGSEKVLGEFYLGKNWIISQPSCRNLQMEFSIGPLQHLKVNDFLDSSKMKRLLECFCSFFVPMEFDTITKIVVERDQEDFVLNDNVSETILGYNTAI